MKYDFTSIMNRHGKDAIAVDSVGQMNGFAPEAPKPGFDVIPMWVADMNFPTVPTIQQAIIERAQHPAFGYFSATDEYYDSIIRWHQTRNGVIGLTKECIGYENGVLGGVISALTSFAAPGDAVLLHSPTYIGFTASVENNGYKIVHSPLVKDENGVWRMDLRIWMPRSRRTTFMWRSSAARTTPAAACGSAGSWKRRWRSTAPMTVLSFRTKSGRISF